MKNERNRMLDLAEIKRVDMPQVKINSVGELIFDLKHIGIPVQLIDILTGDITPTQEDYIQDKVDRIADAISSDKYVGRILVSNDYHIIDGHHRWLANKKLGNKMSKCIVISLPIDSALETIKGMDV